MTKLIQFRVVLALALTGLVACRSSDSTNAAGPASREASERSAAAQAAPRDLSQDEAAGGHVLRKHVGRTDDELRQRLEQEPNISGASTYTDRPTAERAVGDALGKSNDRIQRWLSRSGGHPNLVLDYDSDQPIGRTINRGDRQSRPCSHALVVLRYDPPDRYHVLTSYPECR
ncbi:MAG: RNase A-like domain-containing protein [Terriglobales bacterium]